MKMDFQVTKTTKPSSKVVGSLLKSSKWVFSSVWDGFNIHHFDVCGDLINHKFYNFLQSSREQEIKADTSACNYPLTADGQLCPNVKCKQK